MPSALSSLVIARSCKPFRAAVYSSRVRAGTLLLAVALSGCHVSNYARRGDQRLVEGSYGAAIANYDAALGSDPDLSPEERERVTAARREAIAKLADQILETIDQYVVHRQHDQAIAALAPYVKSGAFGIDAVKRRFTAALDEVAEQRWQMLEPDIRRNAFFSVAPTAEYIEQATSERSTFKQRLASFREHARKQHLALAEGAPPASRLFHLRAAQRFGANGFEQEINALLEGARMTVQANYRLVIEKNPQKECAPFVELLQGSLGKNAQGVPVVVRLRLDECAHQEQHWKAKEVFSYPDWEAYQETSEEYYYARSADDCPEPACARYDQLGVCVERAPSPDCDKTGLVLRTRDAPVTKYRTITATLAADVEHRRLAAGVRGSILVEWSGTKYEVPFDRVLALEEREYWAPANVQRFTSATLDTLVHQVAIEAVGRVTQTVGNFSSARGYELLQQFAVHRDAGREREAEAALVGATLLFGSPPQPAFEWFGARYGLVGYQLTHLLNGQLHPTQSSFPLGPYGYPDHADDRFVPVRKRSDRQGYETLGGDGFDLFLRTETSPLDTAKWFESVGVRIRGDNIHLTLEGRSPELAGDSSGFSASIRGILGRVDDRDGAYFSFGVAWENERAESGERRYHLGVPLALFFPAGDAITIEARADLNFLSLIELSDDNRANRHFYLPLSLRAEIDTGRFYFAGAVRHYLGAGSEHLADGGVEIGLRL